MKNRTFQLAHPIEQKKEYVSQIQVGSCIVMISWQCTWGQGVTIGTTVIAGDCPDQLGEGLFVTQLLPLTDAIGHGERGNKEMNGHNTRIVEEKRKEGRGYSVEREVEEV